MLYLFNSAFRTQYRVNVLNTLYLPQGYTNEYRYEASTHVQPVLNTAEGEPKRGERVLITFIDRHAPGEFRFIPMRSATFLKTWEAAGRRYFRVKLDEHVFPADLTKFNEVLREREYSLSLPQMVDNDPDKPAKGYLAFTGERDILAVPTTGDNAWLACAKAIASTKDFNLSAHDDVLFLRSEITHNDKSVEPVYHTDVTDFRVVRNTNYSLRLTYYFPAQERNRAATGSLSISFTDNLLPTGSTQHSINNRTNQIHVPFRAAADSDALVGTISMKFSPDDDATPPDRPLIADQPLAFRLRSPHYFPWLLLGCAIVYAASVFANKTPPTATTQPTRFETWLRDNWIFIGGIASVIQTFALLGLFWLFGKKKPV